MFFSIICVYNDKKTMEEMLIKSLEKQAFQDKELLTINSVELGLEDAGSALNFGAKNASGDYLMFVHQDIELLKDTALQELAEYVKNNDFDLAGVVGVVPQKKSFGVYGKRVFSSVVNDINRWQVGEKIVSPMVVSAIDECVIIIKKDKFLGFSYLGKTWHFYAVDYSIRVGLNNGKILLFPIEVYHLSPGWSLNDSYWNTLKTVANKYKGKIKYIPTTVSIYNNNLFLPFEIFIRKIKRKIILWR